MAKIIETKDYALIDRKTGEIYEGIELHSKKSHIGGNWMIINQEAMKLMRSKKIRGESRRVWDYLIEKLQYSNVLPLNKRIAIDLELNRSNVTRALKQLAEVTAIVPDEDGYILNPLWGWKGNQIQRHATIKRLQDKGVKL